jgi:hypothetical protein
MQQYYILQNLDAGIAADLLKSHPELVATKST